MGTATELYIAIAALLFGMGSLITMIMGFVWVFIKLSNDIEKAANEDNNE